jgi:hypothetical protein
LPVPLLPLVTVIHAALLVAVHGQPLELVTLTLPELPPAAGLALPGEMLYVQPLAWLIVNVLPPIVIVPVLAGPGLADTV